jgi:hypothetical protein
MEMEMEIEIASRKRTVKVSGQFGLIGRLAQKAERLV